MQKTRCQCETGGGTACDSLRNGKNRGHQSNYGLRCYDDSGIGGERKSRQFRQGAFAGGHCRNSELSGLRLRRPMPFSRNETGGILLLLREPGEIRILLLLREPGEIRVLLLWRRKEKNPDRSPASSCSGVHSLSARPTVPRRVTRSFVATVCGQGLFSRKNE